MYYDYIAHHYLINTCTTPSIYSHEERAQQSEGGEFNEMGLIQPYCTVDSLRLRLSMSSVFSP
jgi:hypothetical protein